MKMWRVYNPSTTVNTTPKRLAEFASRGDPTEKFLDVVERCFLDEIGSGMMRGIMQHDAEVFEEKAVSQR
jgi:hypothetical protein